MQSRYNGFYLIVLVIVFVSGCATHPPPQEKMVKPLAKQQAMTRDDLLFSLLRGEYQYWRGAPYRLGGRSRKGIDCSALVQAIFANSFNLAVPRTTGQQAKFGVAVKRNALKVADLVFFKTGWKVRHVGIYLGQQQFLHASTSNGVIISSLNNVYWNSKYWQSRRVID